MVALVGGGGKTSAVCLLAAELASRGMRVLVTTTTAMFLHEMSAAGPVVMGAEAKALTDGLRKVLAKGRTASVARCAVEGGKVAGLSPAVVDEVWAEGLVDHLIVEADGSRGRPLKAFGPHEPQVPVTATTIVQVAGLDALGAPLTDENVHRSETLAALLAIPHGSTVTARVIADSLRVQVPRLLREGRAPRLAVLLNKADCPAEQASGLAVAEALLEGAAGVDGVSTGGGRRWPDALVVASLRERRFACVSTTEGRA
jgi:probable selenium-dependent hydroxylase accessory protein YqeC